jgi:hypothetical protein
MGEKKLKTVANHIPGTVRYFTYYLEFPDGERWQDQIPFVHALDFEIKNTNWPKHNPSVYRDIVTKGEARFTDQNGVKHIIVVEEKVRPRHWGKGKASRFTI